MILDRCTPRKFVCPKIHTYADVLDLLWPEIGSVSDWLQACPIPPYNVHFWSYLWTTS